MLCSVCIVCLRLVSCVRNVARVSGLFILDCPFTMLREFLGCIFLIAPSQFCGSFWIVYSWLPLHNVAGVSGLFILDCPFTILREFLDCLFLIVPSDFSNVYFDSFQSHFLYKYRKNLIGFQVIIFWLVIDVKSSSCGYFHDDNTSQLVSCFTVKPHGGIHNSTIASFLL